MDILKNLKEKYRTREMILNPRKSGGNIVTLDSLARRGAKTMLFSGMLGYHDIIFRGVMEKYSKKNKPMIILGEKEKDLWDIAKTLIESGAYKNYIENPTYSEIKAANHENSNSTIFFFAVEESGYVETLENAFLLSRQFPEGSLLIADYADLFFRSDGHWDFYNEFLKDGFDRNQTVIFKSGVKDISETDEEFKKSFLGLFGRVVIADVIPPVEPLLKYYLTDGKREVRVKYDGGESIVIQRCIREATELIIDTSLTNIMAKTVMKMFG